VSEREREREKEKEKERKKKRKKEREKKRKREKRFNTIQSHQPSTLIDSLPTKRLKEIHHDSVELLELTTEFLVLVSSTLKNSFEARINTFQKLNEDVETMH
jgi:hypothetical protein